MIGQMGYIALTAFAINLIVAAILTFVFNAMKVKRRRRRDHQGRLLRRRG